MPVDVDFLLYISGAQLEIQVLQMFEYWMLYLAPLQSLLNSYSQKKASWKKSFVCFSPALKHHNICIYMQVKQSGVRNFNKASD